MRQVLIALDQLANTFAGGHADETISARAYRWEKRGIRSWPRRLIDAVFFWDKNHCEEAHLSELLRRHLPRQYRTTK